MKGSPKPSVYQFQDPLYKSYVRWCITDDLDAAAKFLGVKRKLLVDASGFASYRATLNYRIWFKNRPVDIDTFVHKIYHLKEYWEMDIGKVVRPQTDEPAAYYIGWIAEKMKKELENACNPPKKKSR